MSSGKRVQQFGKLQEIPFRHKKQRNSSPNPTANTPDTTILGDVFSSLMSASTDKEIANPSTLARPTLATGDLSPLDRDVEQHDRAQRTALDNVAYDDGVELYNAAMIGDIEYTPSYLDNGVDVPVNARGGFYNNALQAAAYRGEVGIMQLLLRRRQGNQGN